MNSKWRIIFTSLAASIVLAACGTGDTEQDADDSAGSAVEEPAANPETGTDTDAETDVDDDAVTSDSEAKNENALKDAVETKSDEQDYSVMVLPGYTLTSEEPGRDSLYLDEDGNQFMRIEAMPKGEETYTFDELYENMGELLKASSDGSEPEEVTDENLLPDSEGIIEAKGMKAESDEGYFEGYVMDREDKLVRVTIYASEDGKHVEELREMASSIK